MSPAEKKFECDHCGKRRCNAPNEFCSKKCQEAAKKQKVKEVLLTTDPDEPLD